MYPSDQVAQLWHLLLRHLSVDAAVPISETAPTSSIKRIAKTRQHDLGRVGRDIHTIFAGVDFSPPLDDFLDRLFARTISSNVCQIKFSRQKRGFLGQIVPTGIGARAKSGTNPAHWAIGIS
jgi:hypothetical protein